MNTDTKANINTDRDIDPTAHTNKDAVVDAKTIADKSPGQDADANKYCDCICIRDRLHFLLFLCNTL